MLSTQWFRLRRTLYLFLGMLALVAVSAGWFGWRFIEQDQALEEQRIRDRLESTADVVVAELGIIRNELENRLESLAALPPDDLPNALQSVASELGGAAVLVRMDVATVTTYPARALLYLPVAPKGQAGTEDQFAEGEGLEFRGQHRQAIQRYRDLLSVDDRVTRAGALLRVARVHRKEGRVNDALATYDELLALGETPVARVPAALLALGAMGAIYQEQGRWSELLSVATRLRSGLRSSKWAIDRATFRLYSEDADTFLASAASGGEPRRPSIETGGPIDTLTIDALSLAVGAEIMWRAWIEGSTEGAESYSVTTADLAEVHEPGVSDRAEVSTERGWVLWRGNSVVAVGLIAAPTQVRRLFIEPLAPILQRQSALLLLGPRGGDEAPGLQVRRSRAETGMPWEVKLVSADPEADRARLAERRRLLTSVAAVVAVLVAAAGYLSIRAVTRELDVARLQSEFVSAVSHDFRTPLTSLRQVNDALLGGRVERDRRRHYYEIQRRGIERLHRLVESLLDFGRMEAGALEFERRPIAVRRWVDEVVGEFRDHVERQAYSVEFAWNQDVADLEIRGDEQALTRAFWNVLDNAVKYSPDCKTVWVECEREPGVPTESSGDPTMSSLVIRVRDHGLGIDPTEKSAIFEKFVRGSAADQNKSSGTGLGLPMVRHIVEAHAGDVRIEGSPGKGTTIEIRLPVGRA